MRLGRYSVVVASATATKSLTESEWNMISDRVKPVDISNIKSDTEAGLVIHDKIQEVYKRLNRQNISVSEKRKIVMYLCHE